MALDMTSQIWSTGFRRNATHDALHVNATWRPAEN